MKTLIVSATENEIRPLLEALHIESGEIKEGVLIQRRDTMVLVTGVGAPATLFGLTEALNKYTPDIVVNAGIAGSYENGLDIGQVVTVTQDVFADLGILMDDGFKPLYKTSFANVQSFGILKRPSSQYTIICKGLKEVTGATVNCAGDYTIATHYMQLYNAEIETMESAAVFYVCLLKKTPFIALRAISNRVTLRSQAEWNAELAIKNLNDFLKKMLHN